jgi:hypothetical protein
MNDLPKPGSMLAPAAVITALLVAALALAWFATDTLQPGNLAKAGIGFEVSDSKSSGW